MRIEYVANGSRRNVRDSVGRELGGRGIAREMRSDVPSQVEQTQATAVQSTAKPAKAPARFDIGSVSVFFFSSRRRHTR